MDEVKELSEYQKQVLPIGYIYKLWSKEDDKVYFGSCGDYVKRIKKDMLKIHVYMRRNKKCITIKIGKKNKHD